MSKPVLLVVDDDPQVLAAVRRDLRSKYREQYTVISAASGQEALTTAKELKGRGDSLAMIISDQRMPGMQGAELLAKSREVYPLARRVLLTAYSDIDAAVRAINEARLDHYLSKPWEPPEERLFPVVDDLLDAWQAEYLPEATGLRLVGHQWSPRSHAIKDFLAGNLVPYRWLDVERDVERTRVAGRRRDRAGWASGAVVRGRVRAARSGAARRRGATGQATDRGVGALRPRDRGCRSGGTGRRGVRGIGGAQDPAARPACAGWAGRDQLADRELSGFSGGRKRERFDAAGAHAGAATGRGVSGAARGDGGLDRRWVQAAHAPRRSRDRHAGAGGGDRHDVSGAAGAGRGGARWCRGVLRCGDGGGAGVPWAAG